MQLVEGKLWKLMKRNEVIYKVIHNTLGRWLLNRKLKDRKMDIRNKGLDTIFELEEVLSSQGCKFFVDFGTLLGFIRDGEMLPWDYDIDYGIQLTDSFNWDDLEKALNSSGYILERQFSYNDIVTEQTYRKENVFIDFFNHFLDKDCSYYYIYYSKPNYPYSSDNQRHVRRTNTCIIDEVELLSVNNGSVHVPENYDNYLRDVYGDDWKVPKKNWTQKSKSNITLLDGFGYIE